MYHRMEEVNSRLNRQVLGNHVSTVPPMATTTDPLPDGKGELLDDERASSTHEPTTTSTFMMDGSWYVVRSVPVVTSAGTVMVRHECTQEPKPQVSVNPDSTYQAALCFGNDRLVLTSPTGVESVLATSTSRVPYPSRILEDAWLESLNNGDQLVLIGFVWHPCYMQGGQCNASMPYLQPTFGYHVGKDKTYPINVEVGTYARLLWGGNSRAIIVQTCGPAGCNNDPHELRLFNLLTGRIDPLTTLKASYDESCAKKENGYEGCATKDSKGKATPYWKTIRWADANTVEAVYIGANGKSQTVTVHP